MDIAVDQNTVALKKAIKPSQAEAKAAVRTLLAYIGEDPDREGLLDTPARVIRAYEEFFSGYEADAHEVLSQVFDEVSGYKNIVLVKDIPFSSQCEHHMLPFSGVAHVAYYPTDGVVGLSKLARVVELFAKRLQTQENLTSQISNAIDTSLKPQGVAVFLEAEHQCMSLRGIQKPGTKTVTMQFTGLFEQKAEEQAKFISLIRGA